jgi:PEP-CTERM motif
MRKLVLGVLVAGAMALAASSASAQGQCPPAGVASGCGLVITIGSGGTLSGAAFSGGIYDGSEDTLIGVVNSSGGPVSSFMLTDPSTGAFAFDGDGPCTVSPPEASCGADPSGYGGPNTLFSLNGAGTILTVSFPTALADGTSQWFSLEGLPTLSQIGVPPGPGPGPGPVGAPEPGTLMLLGTGLSGLFLGFRRKA